MKVTINNFTHYLHLLLIFSLLALCNCRQKQQESPKEEIQTNKPVIFVGDTLTQNPAQASAAIDTANTIVHFPGFVVVFPAQYQDMESLEGVQAEEGVGITISAVYGEKIEGQTLYIRGEGLTNVSVEQRYETSMFIVIDEGIYTMDDWKHYTSDWEPIQVNEDNSFEVLSYLDSERQKFPKVSKKETEAAIRKHHPGMGDVLVSENSALEADLSRIFLRIRATTRQGKRIETWLTFSFEYNC